MRTFHPSFSLFRLLFLKNILICQHSARVVLKVRGEAATDLFPLALRTDHRADPTTLFFEVVLLLRVDRTSLTNV